MAVEGHESKAIVKRLGGLSHRCHNLCCVTSGKKRSSRGYNATTNWSVRWALWAWFLFYDSLFIQQIFVECLLCVTHHSALGNRARVRMRQMRFLLSCSPSDSSPFPSLRLVSPHVSSPNCFQVADTESFLLGLPPLEGVFHRGRDFHRFCLRMATKCLTQCSASKYWG